MLKQSPDMWTASLRPHPEVLSEREFAVAIPLPRWSGFVELFDGTGVTWGFLYFISVLCVSIGGFVTPEVEYRRSKERDLLIAFLLCVHPIHVFSPSLILLFKSVWPFKHF